MKQLDIQTLIESHQLDYKKFAEALFPANKFPTFALDRLVKGKTELTETQIFRIASFLNTSVPELYEPKKSLGWRLTLRTSARRLELSRGKYDAICELQTGKTYVFHEHKQIGSFTTGGTPDISINEYLLILNKYIQ